MRVPVLLPALAAAALAVLAGPAPRAADPLPPAPETVVVELFTSQGCSSCPPADAILRDLSRREGVIALSLHVDYWDYLGWRDTFAEPGHTKRQYAYRDALDGRVVYTPQMVVQGAVDVAGTKARKIDRLIAEARAAGPGARLEIAAVPGRGLVARVAPLGEEAGAGGEVWAAVYSKAEEVMIERGENKGRTLAYHNVVHDLRHLASWDGAALRRIELPRPAEGQGVALWLQDRDMGPIRAAVRWEE